MSSPAPFLFNVDFQERERLANQEPEIPTIPLADHQALLAAAEEAAYQRGVAAREETESARLADEAQRIANAAEKILSAIDGDQVRMEADAARLALSVAQQLAPAALAEFPLADIEALIADCLSPLRDTPHLVVRLSERDSASIQDVIGKMARENGFEGRFVVLGEPDFADGDCRIEWADGGIVRNMTTAVASVESKIAAYFEAIGAPLKQVEPHEPIEQQQSGLENQPETLATERPDDE